MTKVIILINLYHAFIEYNIRILGQLFNLVLVSVNIIINNWAKIVLVVSFYLPFWLATLSKQITYTLSYLAFLKSVLNLLLALLCCCCCCFFLKKKSYYIFQIICLKEALYADCNRRLWVTCHFTKSVILK